MYGKKLTTSLPHFHDNQNGYLHDGHFGHRRHHDVHFGHCWHTENCYGYRFVRSWNYKADLWVRYRGLSGQKHYSDEFHEWSESEQGGFLQVKAWIEVEGKLEVKLNVG